MKIDYYSTNEELIEYFKYLSKETLGNGLLFLEQEFEEIDDILLKKTLNNLVDGFEPSRIIVNFSYNEKIVFDECIRKYEMLRMIFKSVLESYISYSDCLLTCFFYDIEIKKDKRLRFQDESIPFLIFLLEEKPLKKRNNLELAEFLYSFSAYIRRERESLDNRFNDIKKYLYDKIDDIVIKELLEIVFQKNTNGELIDKYIDKKVLEFRKNWDNRCNIILEISLMLQDGIDINEIENIETKYLCEEKIKIASRFEKALELASKYYIGLKSDTGENYLNYLMNIISNIEDENNKIAFLLARGFNNGDIPKDKIISINLSKDLVEIIRALKKEEDSWDMNFKNITNEAALKILKAENEYLKNIEFKDNYRNSVDQIEIYLKQIEDKKIDEKTVWSYKKILMKDSNNKNNKKILSFKKLKKWEKSSEEEIELKADKFFKEFEMPRTLDDSCDQSIDELIKERYSDKSVYCEIGDIIEISEETANVMKSDSVRDVLYYFNDKYNLEALSEVRFITDIKEKGIIIEFKFFQFQDELRAEFFGYSGDYYGIVRIFLDDEKMKRVVIGEVFDK